MLTQLTEEKHPDNGEELHLALHWVPSPHPDPSESLRTERFLRRYAASLLRRWLYMRRLPRSDIRVPLHWRTGVYQVQVREWLRFTERSVGLPHVHTLRAIAYLPPVAITAKPPWERKQSISASS